MRRRKHTARTKRAQRTRREGKEEKKEKERIKGAKHRKTRAHMRGGARLTAKQACAPTREFRPVKDSCYTNTALHTLKRAYNRKTGGDQIAATDPPAIVAELDSKLGKKCRTESCWVDALDIPEKHNIKKTLFAPKRPASWTKNPREWLSNHDIDAAMDQYVAAYPNFKSVPASAIDYDYRMPSGECVARELCRFSLAECVQNKITKVGIVFNLDKHNLGGSHWVALFIDIAQKYIFFFDSAGASIPSDTKRFIAEVQRQGLAMSPPIKFAVRSNYPVAHQRGDTECGMYALFFISTLVKNALSLSGVIRLFAGKHRFRDSELEAKRSEMFNETV
jgi:hypothetical protein